MSVHDTSSDSAVEFLRQVADLIAIDNLPAPTSVTPYNHTILVDDADLTQWLRALELGEPTWEQRGEWEHARFAEQSSTGIALSSCRQVPVSTVELYECEHCDAKLGIAGVNSGSDEDRAADEQFRADVEFHESGACQGGEPLRAFVAKAESEAAGKPLPCSCGSPETYSLNPNEVVVHRRDGKPCYIGDAGSVTR